MEINNTYHRDFEDSVDIGSHSGMNVLSLTFGYFTVFE